MKDELKFVTWLKSTSLPILPEPLTVYIIKDSNEFELKITDSDSNYLDQVPADVDIPAQLIQDVNDNNLHRANMNNPHNVLTNQIQDGDDLTLLFENNLI